MKSLRLYCAAACLLPAACATPGGGPFGIVMFDPDQHVSAAEPLFGKQDLQCLDNPTYTLSIYSRGATLPASAPAVCREMAATLGAVLAASGTTYDKVRRNEVIDSMMAASDRKCGRYVAFLQQYDGNINSTFGIASQAAAIIATLATGGTAQGFAAAAGILGGARGTLNHAHFANQTIGVLAKAFETKRASQREAIAKLQAMEPDKYTVQRGLQDAFRYHATCSIASGLEETQRAVEEAASPSLATMTKFLENMEKARQQMQSFLDRGGTVPPAAVPLVQPSSPSDQAPPIP